MIFLHLIFLFSDPTMILRFGGLLSVDLSQYVSISMVDLIVSTGPSTCPQIAVFNPDVDYAVIVIRRINNAAERQASPGRKAAKLFGSE